MAWSYQPRPGDIGITKISGAGGRWIRRLQWLNGDGYEDFEHAFVVESVDPVTAQPWIVEAMPGGAVHVVNWHRDVRWLVCPEEYRAGVAQAALDSVGIGYSWADYGALGLHRFHLPTPLLKRYITSSGHMICSQLADHAALKGGWHLFDDGRWEGDVTPGDLTGLWRKHYNLMNGTAY